MAVDCAGLLVRLDDVVASVVVHSVHFRALLASVVPFRLVKHAAVVKSVQYFVSNRPIGPNTLDFYAMFDGTSCIRSIFRHFEILE